MFKTGIEQNMWVEKYRPSKLSDMILSDSQRDFFNKCLIEGEIPHILLSGPAGSGKTSVGRILYNELIKNDSDGLIINASDNNNVEFIRTTVSGFLRSPSIVSKRKIVFLDECDYISLSGQAVLRGVLENSEGRFIMTCNYISKIMDALVSRTQSFIFDRISEDFAFDYCKKILDSENVNFEEKDVRSLIKALHPNIRKVVNVLQQNTTDGQLKHISADELSSVEKKIIGLMLEICDRIGQPDEKIVINKNVSTIQKLLSTDREPDYRYIYGELFNSKMPPWGKIKINQYANNHMGCAIPVCHFEAMIFDIIMAGKGYIKMFSDMK